MFEKMKNHFEAWVSSLSLTVESDWHKGVVHFMNFAEGRQAEQDAVNLLLSKGYAVTKNGAEVKATT